LTITACSGWFIRFARDFQLSRYVLGVGLGLIAVGLVVAPGKHRKLAAVTAGLLAAASVYLHSSNAPLVIFCGIYLLYRLVREPRHALAPALIVLVLTGSACAHLLIDFQRATDAPEADLIASQRSMNRDVLSWELDHYVEWRLEVDLSSLEEIGDAIYVGDIQAPPRVKILADPEDMIALITAPEAEPLEEEEEVAEIEIEGEEPEVIERGKREEDEDF